jgi:hypothetical protein
MSGEFMGFYPRCRFYQSVPPTKNSDTPHNVYPSCRQDKKWWMTNAVRTESGYIYVAVGGLCWECGTLVEGWPLHSAEEVLNLYRTDPVTKAKVVVIVCSHRCKVCVW